MNQSHHEALCDAAMCLWEAVLELLQSNSPTDAVTTALQKQQRDEGMASMRTRCMHLAGQLHGAYEAAVADGYDDAFDWEFTPDWLNEIVQKHGQLP